MSDAPYPILKHRSNFDFYAIKDDGDPFMAAANLVVEWFVQKESQYEGSPIAADFSNGRHFPRGWNYSMPEDYEGGDYDDDRWPALACAAEKNDEGAVTTWTVEYDEPDANHDDRRWHTVIRLDRGMGEGDPCHIGMQTICRPLPNCTEQLPNTVAAPALLRDIVNMPWYVAKAGSTQLQTVPNKLSAQTFDHFAAALTDPGRKIPLVLFCTGYDGKMPEAAKQLARRALGTCNVYVVDWSNEELRNKELALFERGTAAGEYACPKASCRMYMPGVDLTDHNASMSHLSWNREALAAVHPSQFAEQLARRFLSNTPIQGINDPEPVVPGPRGGKEDDAQE